MESQPVDSSSDEESINAEEIVVQGFRQVRSRTNWRYRGTAMTTTDLMDLDELRLEVLAFETALGYIAAAFTALATMARARTEQNLSIQRFKRAINYLSIAVAWIASYIEGLYLDIEDRLYFVHTIRPYSELRLRSIDDLLDDNQSESLFGFKIHELQLLRQHWRIPNRMREGRNVFNGEEAMLVFLYHIRTATPNTHMASRDIFGGDPRLFTHYIRAITDHLYSQFYHKISGDSMRMWTPFVHDFRAAIWDKLQDGIINERDRNGREVNWEILLPAETFRIFGWLDDTDMRTNRPRAATTVDTVTDVRDTQQAFYK
jgi:hypothetical protein